MTPDTIDLGRRLLALGVESFVVPAWLAEGPSGCGDWHRADDGTHWRWVPDDNGGEDGAWLPDVGDAATRGVLVEALGQASEPFVWLEPSDDFAGWLVMSCYAAPEHCAVVIAEGPTESAAIVAALEAACRTT